MGFRLLTIPKHFHFSALTNVLLMWIIHVQHKCEKLNTFGTLAMLFFFFTEPSIGMFIMRLKGVHINISCVSMDY